MRPCAGIGGVLTDAAVTCRHKNWLCSVSAICSFWAFFMLIKQSRGLWFLLLEKCAAVQECSGFGQPRQGI